MFYSESVIEDATFRFGEFILSDSLTLAGKTSSAGGKARAVEDRELCVRTICVRSLPGRERFKKFNHLCEAILIAFFFLAIFEMPAFAKDENSTVAKVSPQQTSQLIQQLDAAKKADWDAALDPTVSTVRQETFLNQMNKADRASKELSHGFAVPQSEISDALWAPPKHITPEERAKLIQELKQARQEDDHNEQKMLNDLAWSRSAAPANTEQFDERKEQIDSVVKDLEIGTPVHWSVIKQALVVPTSPY
jgi:hypothetical protein